MPRCTILQKDLLQQKNLLVRKGFSSPIWKYFGFPCNPSEPSEPANEDEIVCALCNKCLSYNKSTTVMHKHLKGRHPNVFETLTKASPEKKMAKGKVGRPRNLRTKLSLEEDTIFPTNLVTSKNLVPKMKGSSTIWTFFGFPRDPGDPTQALNNDCIICAICDKELKYNHTRSTSGMRKHLSASHPNAIQWLEEKATTSGRVQGNELRKSNNLVPKRSSSWVWNYFFFPLDPETNQTTKEYVTCDLCEKKMSYHGGTSPMRSHIRLIHKKEFSEHNQWESVEVSQDVLNINANDPKVKIEEDQAEIEESNVASLTEEEIFSDDLLQRKGLVHKKGATSSAIWRFFGFLPDPEDPEEPLHTDKAVCAICGKQLMYSNSSTTVMRNHLEHRHAKIHKIVANTPRKLMGIPASEASRAKAGLLQTSRKKRLTACLANYIAKDLKPLASMEEPSFKKMLYEFDPRYILPSREDFTMRIMPRLYEQVKQMTVMPTVKNAKHVALSIDVWGRSTVEQYMAVTAHLLTSDWELKSFMLENVEFPLPHDALHIAECLNKIAAEWGISDDPLKISALVTNNAVKNSFTGKHVPCLGHTLNSIVVAGLQCPGVQHPIQSCTKLVEFVHGSPKLKIPIEEPVHAESDVPGASQQVDISQQYDSTQHLDVQRQLDVLEQLVSAAQIGVEDHAAISELTSIHQTEAQSTAQQEASLDITMQDLKVPLGTTHSMLRAIIDKRELLKAVLAASERLDLELPEGDMKIVEEIEKVLAPMQTLSETFLGRSYVSVSGLMPSFYYLRAVLKEKEDDLPEITAMKQAMILELSNVYEDPSSSVILPKATFLDARYKKLPFLTEVQKMELHNEIAKEAILLTDNKIDESTGQDEPPSKKPVMAWASLLGGMFDEENMDVEESEPAGGAKDEIRRYLTEPRLGLEADALKWWQQNGPRYPMLSAVAMKYLCIPSTSVPSEHLFSTAGSLITAKRSLLDTKDIQLLPFLNANIQL